MTFASQAEYIEWERPRVEDQLEGGIPRRTRQMWLVGISILVGLMLAFILWWRSKAARRLKMVSVSPERISPPSEPEGR